MGARAEGFERGAEEEGPRKPFYFGMSPPDKDLLPSLPTAVGKVRDNEALSQPFRTAPRHRSKEKEVKEPGVREVLIVPVNKSVINNSEVISNNNNNTLAVTNQNFTARKVSAFRPLPPKEPPQEELNKVFQEQLARSKGKLRVSRPPDEEEEGAPPPPPPPVMPYAAAPPPPVAPSLNPPKWERRVSSLPKGPMVNPRDELMKAIREKAGRPSVAV